MRVRRAEPGDRGEWLRMRAGLWPDDDAAVTERETRTLLEQAARDEGLLLVAEREDGRLGAFLEASLRSHAEGCETTPVAYVEAWYVDPDLRGRAVGRALMDAVASWARGRDLSELASDTDLHNEAGLHAHEALGFEETDRIICLRKPL